jgi:hypothetical protein
MRATSHTSHAHAFSRGHRCRLFLPQVGALKIHTPIGAKAQEPCRFTVMFTEAVFAGVNSSQWSSTPHERSEKAHGARAAGEDGFELQVILPRKPQQALDRPTPAHRQRPAPATQPCSETESVLDRVRRPRRAPAVLQQLARGGQAHESARL